MLAGIDPEIVSAAQADGGYIAFEVIGEKPLLGERSFSRGSHSTSVDAFMIGVTGAGERRAFLIEWKYTESAKPSWGRCLPPPTNTIAAPIEMSTWCPRRTPS